MRWSGRSPAARSCPRRRLPLRRVESDPRRRLGETLAWVRQHSDLRPRIAVILGSGLGSLAGGVEGAVRLPFGDIPHFRVSTAPGHAGALVLGRLEGQAVAVMAGRVHMYEGYTAQEVAYPVLAMHSLGAEILLVTNAAGGVNTAFVPGALMLIADHINLTGRNPLVGPSDPGLGVRFPDMSDAYSRQLRDLARSVAERIGVPLAEGVYLGLLGPSYESPAEIRMARALGADAVGMSTVMEVIAANHAGMRVLGISCITNMAAGILPQKLTEEEVIETAGSVRPQFESLVREIVASL
ncbi:MAG: purine-nucleoside phosphorylase [Chloroflexi bacterium]|nr:purine-nucleoside phosphorylase [Chloroflexota bacterium]